MILDFQSMGFAVFFPLFPVIITIISLLSLVLIWTNRRIFVDLFKNINKVSLLILVLITIVFVLICAFEGLNFKFFNASDAEWMEINAAKQLSLGNFTEQLQDRMVFPLILALGFRIFGLNPLVASFLNLFLAVLSIFLVFTLTQIVFKNEKASLLSAFIFTFTPFTLIFTSLRMGDPTVVGFFFLLFIIAAILAFRYHRLSLHILTLIFFALVSQTKLEYFILIFPYVFCFIIFKEYKHIPFKKIIILIVLFFLFCLPFFAGNDHFRKTSVSGWCGYPSQTFHNGKVYSYTLPLTVPLDRVLKFLANGRFSINYLVYDMPNFLRLWFSKQFVFISLFIILGIIFAFKEHKKEALFILFSFLSISIVYLADCIFYETRLAIPSYGPIVIFSGLAIDLFSKKISRIAGKKKLIEVIITGLIILVLLLSWYFDSHSLNKLFSYRNYNNTNIVDNYNGLKNVVDYYGFLPSDSYFLVVQHVEKYILKFLGYKADCLTDIVGESYFRDRQKFFESLTPPLKQKKNNYFIYSWYCETLDETADICNFVTKNYVEAKVGDRGGYIIYSLNTK